jgi:ABC-type phosphate transport system, periplasmic component
MKKLISALLSIIFAATTLTACSGSPPPAYGSANPSASGNGNTPAFDGKKDIVVVSREDSSGTRGAFIELFGIEQKNDDGTKKDLTTKEAIIAKQTDVMMTNIAGNPYAIGYISLGSMNDTVKALQIEGVTPAAMNVKNGTYSIARPFNIATKAEISELTEDFIGFILSADGQAVVANGYISIDENAPAYTGSKPSGKIVVAGSSSATPIMEKLKEAYLETNSNAAIEIQMSDSSAGITGAIDGTCDIGMASRELKDSELPYLTSTQIALDGIAVIVNHANPATNLKKEQVKSIFTGKTLIWSEVE